MMVENLEGMTSEQLMLRDLIYEVNEVLVEHRGSSFEERLALARIATLLERKLQVFDIDQSRFGQRLLDVDAWLVGTMQ
jgi:hypothetical protein